MYSKVALNLMAKPFVFWETTSQGKSFPIVCVLMFGFAIMRHFPDLARARIIAGWEVCEIKDHPNPLHNAPIYALIAFPIPTP